MPSSELITVRCLCRLASESHKLSHDRGHLPLDFFACPVLGAWLSQENLYIPQAWPCIRILLNPGPLLCLAGIGKGGWRQAISSRAVPESLPQPQHELGSPWPEPSSTNKNAWLGDTTRETDVRYHNSYKHRNPGPNFVVCLPQPSKQKRHETKI